MRIPENVLLRLASAALAVVGLGLYLIAPQFASAMNVPVSILQGLVMISVFLVLRSLIERMLRLREESHGSDQKSGREN